MVQVLRFALFAGGFCLVASTVSAASFTPLGTLNGYRTDASGVSADGTVVTGSARYPQSEREAWRWTADDGLVGLGELAGGAYYSQSYAVSGDGSVVVGLSRSTDGYEAFRWTSAGGMSGLGDFSGGTFDSAATGVSADGTVVVGHGRSETGVEAFYWTESAGMTSLGSGRAYGVSADGTVVVGQTGGFSGEAFAWTDEGGMVGLGYLAGGSTSTANAASADGSVIVGSSSNRAFRWTAGGGMVSLGILSGGAISQAHGVSGDGSVVVGHTIMAQEGWDQAFIWNSDIGMQPLLSYLISNGATGLDGYILTSAMAVSSDGQWVVGQAVYVEGHPQGYGDPVAFLANISPLVPIPVPAAAWLMFSALGALALLRRS